MVVQFVTSMVTAAVLSTGTMWTVPIAPDGADPGLLIPCGAVWNKLPEELQADLKELRDLPPQERPAAAKEIRADALAGEYGKAVQRWSERRDERRAWVRARMPRELKRDLAQAWQLPAGERRDAFLEIRDDALAGDYGRKVERVAEQLQERREECRSQN